jgi:hypothetical protein
MIDFIRPLKLLSSNVISEEYDSMKESFKKMYLKDPIIFLSWHQIKFFSLHALEIYKFTLTYCSHIILHITHTFY